MFISKPEFRENFTRYVSITRMLATRRQIAVTVVAREVVTAILVAVATAPAIVMEEIATHRARQRPRRKRSVFMTILLVYQVY